jgi:hypothetical protein
MPNQTLAASAARTTSGNGTASLGNEPATTLRVQLECTSASGTTPTLDVVLEDSVDGTNYNVIATFTQLTGTGRQVANVTTPFTGNVRARWTIGGTTPSFTFSVVMYYEP